MPGASLTLFADLGACHVQKSSVTICVLPALPVKRYRRSISIHALRVEGDCERAAKLAGIRHFYPHPPGGGRPAWQLDERGNTGISIHALRVEGDRSCIRARYFQFYFYPRPPGGGRPSVRLSLRQLLTFLSTPSGWRATQATRKAPRPQQFLSTPSGWRATAP